MFAALNSINNQDFDEIRGVSSKSGGKKTQTKRKEKLLDRVEDAKTKKEKTLIIKEWVVEEIKKINKASEMEDF